MTGRPKKSIRAIQEERVGAVFSDECIAELARIARLPPNADRQRFVSGIRAAARGYARDVRSPNLNEQRAEIEALHSAASRRQYERVATLIASMSPQVRALLNRRGALRKPAGKVPTNAAIADKSMQETACETLESLCRLGGAYGEGRKRKTGKRSRSWQVELYAPSAYQRPTKREAERTFTRNLQLTWLETTGKQPSPTAHADALGPFARMVRECFALVGAASTNASVVEYLSDLNPRQFKTRQAMRDQRRKQNRRRREKRRGVPVK